MRYHWHDYIFGKEGHKQLFNKKGKWLGSVEVRPRGYLGMLNMPTKVLGIYPTEEIARAEVVTVAAIVEEGKE